VVDGVQVEVNMGCRRRRHVELLPNPSVGWIGFLILTRTSLLTQKISIMYLRVKSYEARTLLRLGVFVSDTQL
jgi:hypothetical protein